MSECHFDGSTRQENYSREMRCINAKYDRRLKDKCFLTSAKSIEEERKKALKDLDESYHGKSRIGQFGCFTDL